MTGNRPCAGEEAIADDRDRSGLVDPLDHLLGYQLRRASAVSFAGLAEAFEGLDLRLTEAVILRFVAANPRCNQAEIGKSLGVRRTNMVPIVGSLVGRGLLDREPADGRTNALTLTAAGVEVHDAVVRATDEHERAYFGDIDEPTRSTMMAALRSIRAKRPA